MCKIGIMKNSYQKFASSLYIVIDIYGLNLKKKEITMKLIEGKKFTIHQQARKI
jgi:hypothetical protein